MGAFQDLFEFGHLSFAEGHKGEDLKVVQSDGWLLKVDYKDSRGNLHIKPGYVAKTAGATITFEVNSRFPELPGERSGQLVITSTTSYDGWGTVHVSCVSGCTCDGADIDAMHAERTSLQTLHEVHGVTQHPACHVRFEVLRNSSSGGHKFKISTLSVQIEDHDLRER